MQSSPVGETSEEGREFLQRRVALFWKVMFFVCLFGVVMGASGAVARPGLDFVITAGLAVEASAVWWLCSRGQRSARFSRVVEGVEAWDGEKARLWWVEHRAKLELGTARSTSGPKTIAVDGALRMRAVA